MAFDPKGKYVLITGGASGIGLAITKELLRNGVKGIFIADIDEVTAEKVVQELNSEFGVGKATFLKCDVTNADDLQGAFQKAIQTHNRLDIVINNAGILDESKWEWTIAINLTAVVRGTKIAFEMLGKHRGGRGGVVVNIASVLGLVELHSCPVYVATKHAVIGLSKSLGTPYYFDRYGIRVVTMCPGLTNTELLAKVQKRRTTDELSEELMQQTKCFITQEPEDVAKGVLHILRHGMNGSIWISDNFENPHELFFSKPEDMRKVE